MTFFWLPTTIVCSNGFLERAYSRLIMVELSGIEPLTSCVQGRRSPS